MKKPLFLAVFFAICFVVFFGSKQVFAANVVVPVVEAGEVGNNNLDLTVPKVKVDRMMSLLSAQKLGSLGLTNFLKHGIRSAVSNGVSINTLVLLFLFPLVATLVAFSRQVVGLNGFGMITPALLAMAFLSTGGLVGIIMLSFVVSAAILGRMMIKKVKIPFLPKLAMLFWIVSMFVLILIVLTPIIGIRNFLEVGIFPIILFVSVAETFIESQITRNFSSSMTMLIEAVILAFVGYKTMSSHFVQSLVLLSPEMMAVLILVLNLIIGRYKGLRLMEVWRFRKIIIR